MKDFELAKVIVPEKFILQRKLERLWEKHDYAMGVYKSAATFTDPRAQAAFEIWAERELKHIFWEIVYIRRELEKCK